MDERKNQADSLAGTCGSPGVAYQGASSAVNGGLRRWHGPAADPWEVKAAGDVEEKLIATSLPAVRPAAGKEHIRDGRALKGKSSQGPGVLRAR